MEQTDCVSKPASEGNTSVPHVLGLDKRLHRAEQTIQQLQLEIQRQRAGLPLRMSPAPCNGTLSPTGGNGTVASATSLPQSLAPSSLTGSSSGKVAPGIDAGDGSGAGNEREQLQQLAALQEEVLALKAALVGQPVAANRTSSTSSSTTSSARASMDSARMRDQGPIPVAVAAEVAGPAAAAAYANTALENLKTAALCASVPSASTPAAAGTAEQVPFVAPPLLKTTSAGEKVAGLLQELKMAMAEAEVEQPELPAAVRSGLKLLIQTTGSTAGASLSSSSKAAASAAPQAGSFAEAVFAVPAVAAAEGSESSAAAPVTPNAVLGVAVRHAEIMVADKDSDTDRRACSRQGSDEDVGAQDAQQVIGVDEQMLLSAIARPLGFHKGKPLAALIIFRCCLEWGAVGARKTRTFEHIIQVIVRQIEEQQQENMQLAYWLTNTITLLLLLHNNTTVISNSGSMIKRPPKRNSKGWLWSLADVVVQPAALLAQNDCWLVARLRSMAGMYSGSVSWLRPVQARAPALRFMQQLDVLVQKIFPMLRDRVKRKIMPMLWESQSSCAFPASSMHSTPRHGPGGTVSTFGACASSTSGASSSMMYRTTSSGSAAARAAIAASLDGINEDSTFSSPDATINAVQEWNSILGVFEELLQHLHDNWVPPLLVKTLFEQLFGFVNVQLFHQLMLRRECCTLSKAECMQAGLNQVEAWINERYRWLGSCWAELLHTRQAVAFLVAPDKQQLSFDAIRLELCPLLTNHQLYRLVTMYCDDVDGSPGVSDKVIADLKSAMVAEWRTASHSFLLDEESTTSSSTSELLAHLDDSDLYVALPVPGVLKRADGRCNFDFLQKELRPLPL